MLVVAPWTAWWSRNLFGDVAPWIHAALGNVIVRVGVSGVGMLTIAAGLGDLRDVWSGRIFAPERGGAPSPRDP